jgi:N6-adenosine-specific RNA methylase IME4
MAAKRELYGSAIIDPAWDICQKGSYGAVNHYGLMTLEKIKAMPIGGLMKEDSHVWLWVTNNTLRIGYDVLENWGFSPKSVFHWVKPGLGLGVYLRNATESVILGVRGKAPIRFKSQPNWGFFPRQDHSHKPEEFHKIVERCSPGPYLELFARRKFPGWDVWGNEIASDIDIPGYPVPESPATRNRRLLLTERSSAHSEGGDTEGGDHA